MTASSHLVTSTTQPDDDCPDGHAPAEYVGDWADGCRPFEYEFANPVAVVRLYGEQFEDGGIDRAALRFLIHESEFFEFRSSADARAMAAALTAAADRMDKLAN